MIFHRIIIEKEKFDKSVSLPSFQIKSKILLIISPVNKHTIGKSHLPSGEKYISRTFSGPPFVPFHRFIFISYRKLFIFCAYWIQSHKDLFAPYIHIYIYIQPYYTCVSYRMINNLNKIHVHRFDGIFRIVHNFLFWVRIFSRSSPIVYPFPIP